MFTLSLYSFVPATPDFLELMEVTPSRVLGNATKAISAGARLLISLLSEGSTEVWVGY